MRASSSLATDRAELLCRPIRLRGRTYPQSPNSERKQIPEKVLELADHAPQDLRTHLARDLCKRLTSFNSVSGRTTVQLAEDYYRSLQMLHRIRADVEALIPLLCRANFEFRQESGETHENVSSDAISQKLEAMREKARIEIDPPVNVVESELLALPPELADATFRRSLKQNVNRFVDDFFTGLDKLVDRKVCGLVEWTGQNTCRYHFFREIIIQEREEPKLRVTEAWRAEESPTGWLASTTVIDSGTHTYRAARSLERRPPRLRRRRRLHPRRAVLRHRPW